MSRLLQLCRIISAALHKYDASQAKSYHCHYHDCQHKVHLTVNQSFAKRDFARSHYYYEATTTAVPGHSVAMIVPTYSRTSFRLESANLLRRRVLGRFRSLEDPWSGKELYSMSTMQDRCSTSTAFFAALLFDTFSTSDHIYS